MHRAKGWGETETRVRDKKVFFDGDGLDGG